MRGGVLTSAEFIKGVKIDDLPKLSDTNITNNTMLLTQKYDRDLNLVSHQTTMSDLMSSGITITSIGARNEQSVNPNDEIAVYDANLGYNKTVPASVLGGGGPTNTDEYFAMLDVCAPPEMHRTTFRGKSLGTSFTPEQKANVQNGTFKGLWLGDYWEIGGHTWRIVDMDYWLNNTSNAESMNHPDLRHHLMITSDRIAGQAKMYNATTTNVFYTGSDMYKTSLPNIRNMIENSFPGSILSFKQYLYGNGGKTRGHFYDSTIEIPDEIMVLGTYINAYEATETEVNNGESQTRTLNKGQLSLFSMCPQYITCPNQPYWLRNPSSTFGFSCVNETGLPSVMPANYNLNIRPIFAIG